MTSLAATRRYDEETGELDESGDLFARFDARLHHGIDLPRHGVVIQELTDNYPLGLVAPPASALQILPKDTVTLFRSLDEAEEAAEAAAYILEDQSMRLGRVVLAIRDQSLWREGIDHETGEHFDTFDQYLKRFIGRLKRVAGAARSTIYRKMSAICIYERQLGFGPDFLPELGTHATELLRAGNIDSRAQKLRADDEEITAKDGRVVGKKLGRDTFLSQVAYVQNRLQAHAADPDLPEWRVEDTRLLVDQIVGKDSEEKAEWELEVAEVGERFLIKQIRAIVEGQLFTTGDRLTLDQLRVIARSIDNVYGMPEGWR